MPLNIAIIGAGPVGCTLAKILLESKQSIDITIFEGEASFDARTQGGSLDLHDDTGLLALKKAGLYEKFLEYARFDAEAFIVTDKHVKRYLNMAGTTEGKSRGRPEIDRRQLREILLDCLPEGLVKWGHRLQSVTSPSASSLPTDITLNFEHTSVNGFDLIVGADGAYSRVRPLLTDVTPFFSGIGWARFVITDAATRAPELYEFVNKGSMFSFSDHKSICSQQLSDGSLSVSIFLVQSSPDWLKSHPFNTSDLETAKAAYLEQFPDWDPLLRSIIEKSDQGPWMSNLTMLPIGNTWSHRPGITLIGDAAHLMTPFAGEGVNLGMSDAICLADAITTSASTSSPTDSLSPAIQAYEKDMFTRAAKVQQQTYDMMTYVLLEPGAPDANIEKYVYVAIKDGIPALLRPLAQAAVYAYFFYFRVWHRFWGTDKKAVK